ncbi:MAG: hypothetical protein K6G52_06105 [Treponemataceae bacterium]|nr:hypothetical protein [Treponemataceae bacterium]
MGSLFRGCSSLTTITVSNAFGTGAVSSSSSMFYTVIDTASTPGYFTGN